MTRCRRVKDKYLYPVFHLIHNLGHKVTGVKGNRLAGFKIYRQSVFVYDPLYYIFKRADIIIFARYMVPASEIDPFKRTEITSEIALNDLKGLGQRVGILLAQSVKMKTFYAVRKPVRKAARCNSQS